MIAMLLALTFSPLASPSTAAFGPPLVCHEIAIGDAKSLPWEGGMKTKAGYDRTKLVRDVASLLETEENLLVRMETLRRAAVYAGRDRALAWELVGWRAFLVLEQNANAAKESTAWFDLAVLVACFDQLEVGLDFHAGVADGIEGYAYAKKALEQARLDGVKETGPMEFAAALISHPAMGRTDAEREHRRELFAGHMARAQERSPKESLLARNVAALNERFQSKH